MVDCNTTQNAAEVAFSPKNKYACVILEVNGHDYAHITHDVGSAHDSRLAQIIWGLWMLLSSSGLGQSSQWYIAVIVKMNRSNNTKRVGTFVSNHFGRAVI